MLQDIRHWFKVSIYSLAVFVTLAILYLSLSSQGVVKVDLMDNFDKILHATAYFILTTIWFLSLSTEKRPKKIKMILALGILVFGMVIEVLQGTLTDYRVISFADVIANLVGIVLGIILFEKIRIILNALMKKDLFKSF